MHLVAYETGFTDYLPMMLALLAAFAVIVVAVVLARRRGRP
jgi:hypothetical protein